MTKTAVDVAIFEDHPMMREALAQNVVLHSPDANIIYKGSSLNEFFDSVREITPERSAVNPMVAILDLDLGDGSDPSDNLQRFATAGIAVIVVSALAKAQTVRLMLHNGAAAYVSKSAEPEALRDAITATINGSQYMSPDIAIALLSVDDEVTVNLSQKEREALALYASGMKLDAVALAMQISRSTASEYIQRARKKYTKLGINLPTKTDLYRQAQKDGLLK